MTDFVIDASVAIKGFIGEEYSDLAARVLENPVAAPDLLCPECANILWKKVTRDEITLDEVETIPLPCRSGGSCFTPLGTTGSRRQG